MAPMPHDVPDLYLAPLAISIDARITELSKLSLDELVMAVAVASDRPDDSRKWREEALLAAVVHLVDCHGWTLSWDPRGVRLQHDAHTLVLGTPETFSDYLAGAFGGNTK